MSRGQNPLIWMMAMALPGAGHALGLGEIHVDSALNEPLAAEIDLVGVSAEDLLGLRASVASKEAFLRVGADRPPFLSSTTFKVTRDAHGRPVLAIRSTEAFTEPLVNFVVDLRWNNGELVRQYSLLLDPAGFPAAPRLAEVLPVPAGHAALPAPVASVTAPADTADAARVSGTTNRTMTHVKVGAKATLRGIAWRVGARSESDLQQLMLAIFRANPSAFDHNINRMHLGAVLTIPSAEEVAAIRKSDASREIHAQMAAWRAATPAVAATAATAAKAAAKAAASGGAATAALPLSPAVLPAAASLTAALPTAAPPAPSVAAAAPVMAAVSAMTPAQTATPSIDAALSSRIKSLESSLQEVQAQLEREHDRLLNVQAQVRYHEQQPPVVAAPAAPSHASTNWLTGILAGVALLSGVVAALTLRLRRRNSVKYPTIAAVNAERSTDSFVPRAEPAVTAPVAPVATALAAAKAEPKPADWPPKSIEVTETFLEPHSEARIELSEMEPEPPQSGLVADAGGVEAANLREELAAAKLRDEIAAAWALPSADSYRREEHDESTIVEEITVIREPSLADAIAESFQDTVKLKSTPSEDTHATDMTAVDIGATVIAQGDTEILPHAAAFDLPTEAHINMPAETLADTAKSMVPAAAEHAAIDATNLDYNLVDLDPVAQHVQMPSILHENVVAKERRTNLVDVLKNAIEREPDRKDLRMKLLETYYAAAATNRQGFLEIVQKLARDRDGLKDGEWEKIASMGRQIAADNALFDAAQGDDEDLAHCA